MTIEECFKLLEIGPEATIEDIKAARNELLQVWHPDKNLHSPKLERRALEKSAQINEAYNRLIDYKRVQNEVPAPEDETRTQGQPGTSQYDDPAESDSVSRVLAWGCLGLGTAGIILTVIGAAVYLFVSWESGWRNSEASNVNADRSDSYNANRAQGNAINLASNAAANTRTIPVNTPAAKMPERSADPLPENDFEPDAYILKDPAPLFPNIDGTEPAKEIVRPNDVIRVDNRPYKHGRWYNVITRSGNAGYMEGKYFKCYPEKQFKCDGN